MERDDKLRDGCENSKYHTLQVSERTVRCGSSVSVHRAENSNLHDLIVLSNENGHLPSAMAVSVTRVDTKVSLAQASPISPSLPA